MRETRKSNYQSQQQTLDDKKIINHLQQTVEHEYSKLFRQTHKNIQKTASRILQHVAQLRPPRLLPSLDIPIECSRNTDKTVSVVVSDVTNEKSQTYSTVATILPSLTSIRELISYVPTMKNLATRGHLTGIPYLGDKFNDDDQQIINSISAESTKQPKIIRKKKLHDQSLDILYQIIRSNQTWNSYTNEHIIDAILHCHRDSSSRARLIAFADNVNRVHSNIDTCDTIDVEINDLIIKSWCTRFCSRCYTYNCLLHNDKPSHLPLPKQFSIRYDNTSSPCSSTCYKHEREHLKRSLSPTCTNESHQTQPEIVHAIPSEPIENVKKRRRQSTPLQHLSSSTKTQPSSHNENNHRDLCLDDDDDHHHLQLFDTQKKFKSHFLTRIENHMKNHLFTLAVNSSSSDQSDSITTRANQWTLSDRSLFRLFYFLFDGDLCLIKQSFHDHRTCQDMYEEFILDAKYFSDHLSMTHGLPMTIRQPYRRQRLGGATRAFLFHIKKHSLNNQKSSSTLKAAYQPCLHDGPCSASNPDCHCMQTGTFCEKFCNCSIDCPHRFPGCTCKGACLLNNCLCCAEGRECDPDLCHTCGASLFIDSSNDTDPMTKSEPEDSSGRIERKTLPSLLSRPTTRIKSNNHRPIRQHSLRSCRIVEPSYKIARHMTKRTNSRTSLNSHRPAKLPMITCANISLQRKIYKQILIAESDVAGYGAFLGSPIAYPGDLIAEYTGEIISEEEADRRGRLYDKQACSYLFNLDIERCVDARQFGNKIRFANHSSKPNCVPKIKLVNGDYRIGIYARQVILQGEELFFEYMYDAHQRQQFVNNERIDNTEQDGLTILKRYGDNLLLVRSSYD